MSDKSTDEIRQMFLDFFYTKGHTIVPSSSLVPKNDSTLLFTNAGMNQFKNIFLGLENRAYTRVATAQRCIRAGGKHNDLENVGYTARHHTFFEMLGNFSFGDYFKKDAIKYAWELLTSAQWFNVQKERIWITIYYTDEEAYNIWWKTIGIPSNRIIRIGDNKGAPYSSDNFWKMGDTGPCGPCTEIFYDHGEHIFGEPPGSLEAYGDRYIEIWNIVFIQFNYCSNGKLEKLLTPSIDTGMGLERLAAVLQNVHSNYDIDIFCQLISAIAKVLSCSDLNNKSLRVIADHIRSSAFLISDGEFPANEGRGYVLRRIIRRAVHHGYILGTKEIFLYKLVTPLIQAIGKPAYELKYKKDIIEQTLQHEEERFHRTLSRGMLLLDDILAKLQGRTLVGKIAFLLYDTYGFPFDLTASICRERAITIDELGFYAEIEKQKLQARKNSKFSTDYNDLIKIESNSIFVGYENNNQKATVINIFYNNKAVNILHQNEEGIIIIDQTPFYAEAGGQVGDTGMFSNTHCQFSVFDTQKYANAIGHVGKVIIGSIAVNDSIETRINIERRHAICLNHSATHLLHAVLRDVLGKHAIQKGSLVNERSLRFDFSNFSTLTPIQIHQIEDIVNYHIRQNYPITTTLMDLEKAKTQGAIALFSEKYNTQVRVLSIGNVSIELCIGTHVNHTGDIGLFRICNSSSIASGIRRIEAITGQPAIDSVHCQYNILKEIKRLMKCNANNLIEKIKDTLCHVKVLEKSLHQLQVQQISKTSISLSKTVKKIKGINLLVSQLHHTEPKQLRIIVDELKDKLKTAIIVLATISGDKVHLIAGVTNDLTTNIKAVDLITFIAQKVDGKGGGHYTIAQAGGYNITALPDALASIETWVNSRLI